MKKKQEIRKELLKKRKELPFSTVLEHSKQIHQRLIKHPLYQQAKNILFYVSYGNEVYTHDMIKEGLFQQKTIIVPLSDTKTHTIKPCILKNWDDLEKGAYGILEPIIHSQKTIPLKKINLIIIPGVGYDEKGNRIGHGKGYYDRLITKIPKAKLIGLGFEFQIVPTIPIEPHDRKVDTIITEGRTITIT